ncbi:MAG: histidine phosphatase family protein [Clostridia bacterium]|nr:histidine phosphatase family protein [Clostridia bacterium]
MTIYVTRHGQTDWNQKNILLGSTDMELNETGKAQALQLKKQLENINFDHIISSDLKRAHQTAQIISNNNPNIILNSNLRERNYGNLEGTTPENIGQFWNVPANIKEYSVEPIQDFLTRVFKELDNIIQNYSNNQKILIVTHYGVVMAIDAYFHNKFNYCFDNFLFNNCEFRTYEIN